MISLLTYPTDQLPPEWHWQVLSFLRVTWPEGFAGPLRQRDWITRPDDHPLSFLLVEGDLLLGHVNVVWKQLAHGGEDFKAYGLTGVFTYPSVRGQGYGLELVRQATAYIDGQDADVALLNCAPATAPFYQRAGWEPLPAARTWIGPPDARKRADELLMMRFVSARGQRRRPWFEQGDLYFGSDSTW
ncbi:MAG TPA: GNAT family N-acetyltransferase [Herpetosiphonaceae bacterium]|nr:GNAT family N-acetyltransferase [Herpetosiphonaceae bacterium]